MAYCYNGHTPPSVTECGNGKVEKGEDCEPGVEFKETCESLARKLGFWWEGELACDEARCQWDTSRCHSSPPLPLPPRLQNPLPVECDLLTSEGCSKTQVCFWYSSNKEGFTTCVAPRSYATSYQDCSQPGRGCAIGHGCYATSQRKESLCLKYCRIDGHDCNEDERCRDDVFKVPPPGIGVCIK